MDATDPIERALATEPELRPSPGFKHRVMREIHRVVDEPEPLPFPWRRFAAGVAAALLLVVLAVVGAIEQLPAEGTPLELPAITFDPAFSGAGVALLCTVGALLLALRFAFPRRRTSF